MSSLPQWTLADLFISPTDPSIAQSLNEMAEQAERLKQNYKGTLATRSPAEISTLLQQYELILQTIAKPEIYAQLRHEQDSRDSERGAFLQNMQRRNLEIRQDLLFVELELGRLPGEQLEALINAAELQHFRHVLEIIRINQSFRRSDAEEKLWSDHLLTSRQAFIRLFDQEEGSALFSHQGEEKTLTELLHTLHLPDREARRQAALSVSAGLEKTLARNSFIYNMVIQDHAIEAGFRGYTFQEQGRHLDNELSAEAVETLATCVEQQYTLFQRYYNWKRELLGVDTLFDYDRYAPLPDTEQTYSFEEAKTIILNAFNAFSPIMGNMAQTFFDNGWIDAEPRPGKSGGAFCSYVTADTHPYLLVNFQGQLGDVLTLAHELGHGIHAMLARPQGYLQFSTPLTTAETASVFAEMLVFDALKTQITDPKAKQALYLHKIESICATVFRQMSMYRFEQSAHRLHKEQGEQSPEALSELWLKQQQTLNGEAIQISPGYRVWWSYISHFIHVPFYVYAYAFGELLTLALYQQYKQSGPTFAEQYLAFLSLGGSKGPMESLQPLKLDPTKAELWNQGLLFIENLINEAQAIIV